MTSDQEAEAWTLNHDARLTPVEAARDSLPGVSPSPRPYSPLAASHPLLPRSTSTRHQPRWPRHPSHKPTGVGGTRTGTAPSSRTGAQVRRGRLAHPDRLVPPAPPAHPARRDRPGSPMSTAISSSRGVRPTPCAPTPSAAQKRGRRSQEEVSTSRAQSQAQMSPFASHTQPLTPPGLQASSTVPVRPYLGGLKFAVSPPVDWWGSVKRAAWITSGLRRGGLLVHGRSRQSEWTHVMLHRRRSEPLRRINLARELKHG